MSEAVSATDARDARGRRPGAPGGPVFVGRLGAERRKRLEGASERADLHPDFFEDTESARQALTDPHRAAPRCIFVDAEAPELAELVSAVRGQARLFSVPIVVGVASATDAAYTRAHALGADDALPADDAGGVTRRLANLTDFDPAERPPITQGRAIVAHPDSSRRCVFGRILRQAGFDAHFAADGNELGEVAARGEPPALIVSASELQPDGALAALDGVGAGPDGPAAVVLTGDAARASKLQGEAEARGRIAISDEGAPADNLLFLANELMRPEARNARASTRLLHGTLCAFRPAGQLEPVYGLTYNLSREGLYIRTLDPPVPGTRLWLELRPPHASDAVHLRGRVVWYRGLRNPGGAAPPGFGLRIDEEACPPGDVRAYHEGYDTLQAERT